MTVFQKSSSYNTTGADIGIKITHHTDLHKDNTLTNTMGNRKPKERFSVLLVIHPWQQR
jgi:hypothetical protein